ncbi:O-antigen ligase [Pararhizobium capsulatum DSM 1112]|uniref:O-antigen ligase n=1 Tax=Pararhizobium capsulatum DSM 1112 TaxID=1121113 RepID=A0ABU0BTW3_9HYPH|nr:O-antigen ligase family protein [Pararhizobium capsulatum]MDQ0321096.1 O-antigen ligase [Pararhizobium capsulatum DSM 1112]
MGEGDEGPVIAGVEGPSRQRMGRSLTAIMFVAILVFLTVFGFTALAAPALLVALLAGGTFAFLSLQFPVASVGIFVFFLVAFPLYARLPPIGPIPPMPVAAAMLAVIVSTSILAWLTGEKGRSLGSFGPTLLKLFLLFAAVALLSLIDERTAAEGISMWVKVFVIPGAILWVFLFRLSNMRDVDRIFRCLLAACSACALYALLESVLGYNPLLEFYDGQTDVVYFKAEELGSALAYRAFSVFTQPIEYATCLGMIFPYAVIRMATSTHSWQRLFYALGGGLCALGAALTFSRGPLLALFICSVIIGLSYRSLRRALVMLMAAGVLLTAAAWPFLGAGISDRLGDVDNVTLRFKLWQTAFAVFTDHPINGVGIGNFPEYYIEAARQHEIGPFFEFGDDAVENIRVAENTYLQMLAEMGVLGFSCAVLLVLAFFRLVIVTALRATEPLTRNLAIAVGLGGLAYLVNGLTITAYTHFTSTSLFIGVLFPFALILERDVVRRGDFKTVRPA